MTTSTPETTATPAPAKRGWPGLSCLNCGHTDTISLDLTDLDSFRCSDCEEVLSAETIRDVIGQWGAVLRWIELSPTREE